MFTLTKIVAGTFGCKEIIFQVQGAIWLNNIFGIIQQGVQNIQGYSSEPDSPRILV